MENREECQNSLTKGHKDDIKLTLSQKEPVPSSKASHTAFCSYLTKYLNLSQKSQRDAMSSEISQADQLNQYLSYWNYSLLESIFVADLFQVLYMFVDAVIPNFLPPQFIYTNLELCNIL